jgi:transposase InsO family protein
LRAQAPDHVWAIDFQFDQTADGHNLKLLHVVDEFTREALAIECRRRIDADHTVKVLDRLVAERGAAPGFTLARNQRDRPRAAVSRDRAPRAPFAATTGQR